MNSFMLGRYLPLDAFLHKRDPRIKILCMIFFLVAVFMDTGYLGYLFLGILAILALVLSKLSPAIVFKAMRPMIMMLGFLLVINVLILQTGEPLFTLGPLTIYSGALLQTFYIAVRLILMITITTVLTVTTKPIDLTLGIEDLLAPFAILHFNPHTIAMILTLALRFIPTLLEETERIRKAQASRGVDLEEGSLKEKIMAIVSLIVPLFVASFQRAEDLADAMEARGYQPNRKRTRYRTLKIGFYDWLLLFVGLAVMVIYIWWSIVR
ncbi:MAG: energy-coupling factor transporter transmembrane protein EcfT [Erysipelotrichaceae bacterium]|jgi:energy-coupling factor transport system permease protein|nr:energy-coupling factor transporter transmembrane protein EcfT [Erysipelotrichaceae bacterium]